ncbi:MAG: alpha,alpha-trehalase [Clostridia bacterium]|nr:alpha,alpha-trehalase [Clostridia bacterium]
MTNAYRFILDNIDRTTKTFNETLKDGLEIPLIPLPYPFTTPCAEGMFQEMYYWDTYFTHKCLILTKRTGQVRNNLKNFAYLLVEYGKIPNGNRMHYLTRSQPPFFGLMLQDAMRAVPDLFPLQSTFFALEKEYAFWQRNRKTENGLNAYGKDSVKGTPAEPHCNLDNVGNYFERTGIRLPQTDENDKNVIAECESGWDFSPRFQGRCSKYNPVDLNALLYADEILLSKWANELGSSEVSAIYQNLATERKQKMQSLLKKDGVYYDYDFENSALSPVVSCAALYPYFVGLDDDKNGFLKTLNALEKPYGVVACSHPSRVYQWSEPNGWAPLHYVAVAAAYKLGLTETAKRIAEKYLAATDKIFEKTGRLWEKYNAETGDLDVASEYGTPEMLGWTAGVYAAFYHFKESGYQTLI